MIKLSVTVRPLHDGRFLVSYWWSHWYTIDSKIHREYFETEAEAAAFVSGLVTKTRWND